MDKERKAQIREEVKKLVGYPLSLIEQALIKNESAMMEELYEQIKKRDRRIADLEQSLNEIRGRRREARVANYNERLERRVQREAERLHNQARKNRKT